MKVTKSSIVSKAHKVLVPKFENQQLTSFSGLIVFQALFDQLKLKSRIAKCFSPRGGQYTTSKIILTLIVHIILGYRRLQDIKYYHDDLIVKRTLGLQILPSAATLSRVLDNLEEGEIEFYRLVSEKLVLDRLQKENLCRVTADFDGTVQNTKRHAEGTAVGFNKVKKGNRSYYPLLCTVAQTGQVLDAYHRPGNVHDSNGADQFIYNRLLQLKKTLPQAILETRMDSAFFNETIVDKLNDEEIEFTISVPFARFTELKELIEGRKRWRSLDNTTSYFESDWKPKSWKGSCRFIFIRTLAKKQNKNPVQLDLFEPYEYGYEFKVIVTNKTQKARAILKFHNGRGTQEGIIGEVKSHCFQDCVPVQSLNGNKAFLFSGIIAHNLTRELQMESNNKAFNTSEKRRPLWEFSTLETLRKKIIRRAGRVIKPQGKLTLIMGANEAVENELTHYLGALGVTR